MELRGSSENEIVSNLGLSSRPLPPTVKAVEPPAWLKDGWTFLQRAENKPPFQALAFLDHALKLLTRQVEQELLNGKKVHGKCVHGFTDDVHHGRHCLAVHIVLSQKLLTRGKHKESFLEYQKTLYQRLAECCKKCHQLDRAIAIGQHHLSLAKESNDERALVLGNRILSNAFFSKKAALGEGGKKNLGGWTAQMEAAKYAAKGGSLASSIRARASLRTTEAGKAAQKERENGAFQAKEQVRKEEQALLKMGKPVPGGPAKKPAPEMFLSDTEDDSEEEEEEEEATTAHAADEGAAAVVRDTGEERPGSPLGKEASEPELEYVDVGEEAAGELRRAPADASHPPDLPRVRPPRAPRPTPASSVAGAELPAKPRPTPASSVSGVERRERNWSDSDEESIADETSPARAAAAPNCPPPAADDDDDSVSAPSDLDIEEDLGDSV